MYSCVPRERAGEILVEPVGQDRLRLLGRAGVALHQVVEGALRVEHQRVQVPGPVALHLGRRVGQRLHAERVGQAPCRVDRDHAGAPARPRRRQGEGGRHRRLADAARAAAHDDRAVRDQVRQRQRAAPSAAAVARARPVRRAHARALGHQRGHRARQGVRQQRVLGRPDRFGVERGHEQVGQGQLAAEPLHLLGGDRVAGQAEGAGLLERGQVARRDRDAGRRGHLGRRPVQPDRLGVAGVDDHRSELHARLVLQGVGRLDRLRDRQLLGQRHQDHPAAGRVAQQVDHVLGLGPQRPAPGGVDQPAGRGQERDGVAGGRRVDHDQVGDGRPLQLLDLAQDEHVADAGDGGRHHVEHAGAGQPLGHPPQAVVLEILDERVVGGEPPGPHRASPAAGARPGRRQQDLLVAQVLPPAEGGGDPGLALELDDEDRSARLGSHAGQRRAHRRLAHATLAGDDEDVALCAEGPHVHAGPSVVAGLAPQIDRPPKILVRTLESDHPRR